jgi:hypothetical protein
MAQRLSWWAIPGTLVVLGHVVTLGRSETPPAATAPAFEGTSAAPLVVVRDAAGRRSAPLPLAALTAGALRLHVPGPRPARPVHVTLWRTVGGVREDRPWLQCDAPVRADGAIAIGGLPAGVYDVRCELPDGRIARANGVDAPGRATLRASPAATPAPVR